LHSNFQFHSVKRPRVGDASIVPEIFDFPILSSICVAAERRRVNEASKGVTNMKIIVLAFFVLSIVLPAQSVKTPFLVPDVPFHCDSDWDAMPTFTVNYVEFKDSGAAHCPHQLDDALAQIEKARTDNKRIIVLVYIHGWKNDANEHYSADVTKFKTEVAELSHILPAPGPGMQPAFVGIYLAWRGLTLSVEPFKTISYWPRRFVARHVGRTGIYDAVESIVGKVNDNRGDRERTTLIFVGHSFGSRVLENAADAADKTAQHQGFMYRHLQQMIIRQNNQKNSLLGARETTPPPPPADMIIYVNAATASTVMRRTIKQWAAICKEGSDSPVCTAHPFWLAFTSVDDFATGFIMPIANLVFPALLSDHLWLQSAANTPSLDNFDVSGIQCPAHEKLKDIYCPPGSTAEACFGAMRNAQSYCYEIKKHRSKNAKNANPPFWVMTVDGHVVKDHGDIWNENVINMILAIMRQQKRMEPLFARPLATETEQKVSAVRQ
jgi:hypothetical protein